jgi:hypothetical protein
LPSNSPPLRIHRVISSPSVLEHPNYGPTVLTVLKSSGDSVLHSGLFQKHLKWTRTYSTEALIAIRTTTTCSVTPACRMRLFVELNYSSITLVRKLNNRYISRPVLSHPKSLDRKTFLYDLTTSQDTRHRKALEPRFPVPELGDTYRGSRFSGRVSSGSSKRHSACERYALKGLPETLSLS